MKKLSFQKADSNQLYELTDDGETYGSGLDAEQCGYAPDWMLAQGTNGSEGYIKTADCWTPEAKNPEDARENYSERRVKSIPVYEEPSELSTIVGFYDMYYGG